VASLVTTVAHAQKIQLNLPSNSIYFSSNLVGVVLRYLGCSAVGSHRVVNSMGWSTRWGITLDPTKSGRKTRRIRFCNEVDSDSLSLLRTTYEKYSLKPTRLGPYHTSRAYMWMTGFVHSDDTSIRETDTLACINSEHS
jgi:hypothetical protein